jgi:hypothetical protein
MSLKDIPCGLKPRAVEPGPLSPPAFPASELKASSIVSSSVNFPIKREGAINNNNGGMKSFFKVPP